MIMFDNLQIMRNEVNSTDTLFVVGCKDRTCVDGERWVLSTLSTKEAEQLYEYLDKYFKK